MGSRAVAARGRRAISVYGYRGAAQLVVGRLRRLKHEPDTFDRERGTDTARIVRLEALQSVTDDQARLGHRYQASPTEVTLDALRSLPIRYENFTFIDIGSGKGRVLLVAAELPFRRIIGIELASELHDIAVRNIQLVCPRDPRLELVCQDATDYDFPNGPLVLYLYGPFLAPVMRTVMERLTQSLREDPRQAYLVLFTKPDLRDEAERAGFVPVDGPILAWPS